MNCRLIRHEQLAEQYLLGTLAGDQLEAYEQHYFQCDACFDELRQLDEIRQTLINTPVIARRRGPAAGFAGSRWQWPAFAALAASLAIAALLVRDDGMVAGPGRSDPAAIPAARVASASQAAPRTNRSLALARLAKTEPPAYSHQVVRGSDAGLTAAFHDGMAAYMQGRYEAAAEQLREAADAHPARADIVFFLAASELLAGNPAAAAAGFEAVLRLGETAFTDEAYYYHAKAQLALGDPDAARLSLRRIGPANIDLRAAADRLSRQLDYLPAD